MNKSNKIFLIVLAVLVVSLGATSLIPKFRPFGTSTTFSDSTNYVTLNKGFYATDSIKTDRDLIVRGAIVLDTNRLGKIYYLGNEIYLVNNKTDNANFSFIAGFGNSYYTWQKSRSLGVDNMLMQLDTADGLRVHQGDIQLSGGTQQIKIPSDTASDYDNNDAITLNRQSGILTTKSLNTTAGDYYTLTLTNSLISATTKLFFEFKNGSNSAGVPLKYETVTGSGSATIRFYNAHASNAFNGTFIISYIIFN